MNTRTLWSRILIITGGIGMLLGTLDPLEGSLLILTGSGVVALGLFVGKAERRLLRYWLWVFILIAVGVGALFGLSAVGGIGGNSGHSMWWGVLILPYVVGWIMGFASAISALIRFFKAGGQRAHC
jgi:purine-cytosine permease-like protein